MVRNEIWNPLPDELPLATKSTQRFLEWPVKMTGSWCAWQVSNTTPDLDEERSGKKEGGERISITCISSLPFLS